VRRVNVLQSVHLVSLTLPYLIKSRGIIVPVSSLSGEFVCMTLTNAHTSHGVCLHAYECMYVYVCVYVCVCVCGCW